MMIVVVMNEINGSKFENTKDGLHDKDKVKMTMLVLDLTRRI